MRLPGSREKFVVIDEYSDFFNVVVRGVHIELWGDDDRPGDLLYCVYAGMVYDGFFHAECLRVCFCMERALDYVVRCLTPYQEQEEKPGEEPAPGTVDSSEEGSVVEKENSDGQESSDRRGRSEGDSRVQEETGLLVTAGHDCRGYAGRRHTPIGTAKDTFGVTAAAANHMSDSFNSLAADLLHLQHVLTPALSGTGGAAYA